MVARERGIWHHDIRIELLEVSGYISFRHYSSSTINPYSCSCCWIYQDASLCAAYTIKVRVYQSLILRDCLTAMRRSAHFIDPSLRAILDSSSTPDDNDIFLSNLVDIPVLGVHG